MHGLTNLDAVKILDMGIEFLDLIENILVVGVEMFEGQVANSVARSHLNG